MNGNQPESRSYEDRATFDFFGSRMNGNTPVVVLVLESTLLISSEVA